MISQVQTGNNYDLNMTQVLLNLLYSTIEEILRWQYPQSSNLFLLSKQKFYFKCSFIAFNSSILTDIITIISNIDKLTRIIPFDNIIKDKFTRIIPFDNVINENLERNMNFIKQVLV